MQKQSNNQGSTILYTVYTMSMLQQAQTHHTHTNIKAASVR